jgi:hypothetical protein
VRVEPATLEPRDIAAAGLLVTVGYSTWTLTDEPVTGLGAVVLVYAVAA